MTIEKQAVAASHSEIHEKIPENSPKPIPADYEYPEQPLLPARRLLHIVAGILLSALIWSFVGKSDVVVVAEGRFAPKSEMTRVYTPIEGELTEIFVSEGAAVSSGDTLGLIKAVGAVRAAAEADQARINLERTELERKLFPQKRKLMERELENIRQQIAQKKLEYDILQKEKKKNLPASQKNRLNKARLKLEEAEDARDRAAKILEKYKTLWQMDGHGGVSEKELGEMERQYLQAEMLRRDLEIDLESLEFEFAKQDGQAGKQLGDAHIALLSLRFQYENKLLQYENEKKQLEMKYRAALASWEASSVITFDDLDDDHFLKIRAPVSGIITYVAAKQKGEKVKAEDPLVSIAPAGAENTVFIDIRDRDRGQLGVGRQVRLKFPAFPWHRHGHIDGVLEHISPGVKYTKENEPFYEGRVGLERDYFMVDGKKTRIGYGMTARAEISVKKRRLIDLALDPFRKLR